MDRRFENIGPVQVCLIEECSELIQAIMKAERFGYDNYNPDTPQITNAEQIRTEINDVRARCDQMENYLKGR